MTRTTAMKNQKNPDGARGHNERSKMKRTKFTAKRKFTGGPAKYEMEIDCPVYVPGCQPYQCPCKRRERYDKSVEVKE
jgi:hypothetical protein